MSQTIDSKPVPIQKELFSAIQLEKLDKLVKDPELMDALKRVILAGIYTNGTMKKGEKLEPLRNCFLTLMAVKGGTISNEDLGADVRAMYWALNQLESAFNELSKYSKSIETPFKEKKNPAV